VNLFQHLVSYLHVHELTKLIDLLSEARSEVSVQTVPIYKRYFTAFSRSMLLYKGLQYGGDCFVSHYAVPHTFRAMTGLDEADIPYKTVMPHTMENVRHVPYCAEPLIPGSSC